MSVGPVVVGVDDSVDARTAVLWAAQQASSAGTLLLILHSPRLRPAAPAKGYRSAVLRASDDVGQSVLQDSATLARAAQPDVLVRTTLSHAEPAQALIELSAEAHLLVLGSRAALAGQPLPPTSTRLLVSAQARCPVLLLGPVATFGSPHDVGRVVAGVAETRAARAALAFATAEAARREVALQLVQVARQPAGAPGAASAAGRAQPGLLDVQLRKIRRRHRDLRVLTDSVTGDAVEALPSYSDSSSILVVGCQHRDDPWNTRLGPVAASVVRRNRGAVVVVGAGADKRHAMSGRGIEDSWALLAAAVGYEL